MFHTRRTLKTYKDKVRIICHSLRMDAMTGVDPIKVADLTSRIKALPTAERIASMGHGDVLDLSKRLERLLFDIDNSKTSRTMGHALRNRMDKGLPPSRPPLLASGTWMDRAAAMEAQDAGRIPKG